MATRVDLDKSIVRAALEQALQLRRRGAKAATNQIIKDALEQEETAIAKALQTVETIK